MTQHAGGAAIVTTLADAGEVLDSFVAYHLGIGFSRLYLFFDDPDDPDFYRLRGHPNITALRHDAALRESWTRFPDLQWCVSTADQEVMSRQILNTRLAMQMARNDGIEWLLHIDADELFHSPHESVAAHFSNASYDRVDAISYHNHEALSESEEVGDFFRSVTLFKKNKVVFELEGGSGERLAELTRGPGPLYPGRHFNFYEGGKSAVRLAAPGMSPSGVHGFSRPGGFKHRRASRQTVLHYACCGLETLWRKYRRLGAFDDLWWGTFEIAAAVPFHVQARNAVAEGREAARELYRKHLMLDDPALTQELLNSKVLIRITGPSELLAKVRPPE